MRTAGGEAAVGFAGAGAVTDVSIPEIKLEQTPAAPFPTAAGGAAAVGCCLYYFSDRRFGTAAEQKGGQEWKKKEHGKKMTVLGTDRQSVFLYQDSF